MVCRTIFIRFLCIRAPAGRDVREHVRIHERRSHCATSVEVRRHSGCYQSNFRIGRALSHITGNPAVTQSQLVFYKPGTYVLSSCSVSSGTTDSSQHACNVTLRTIWGLYVTSVVTGVDSDGCSNSSSFNPAWAVHTVAVTVPAVNVSTGGVCRIKSVCLIYKRMLRCHQILVDRCHLLR